MLQVPKEGRAQVNPADTKLTLSLYLSSLQTGPNRLDEVSHNNSYDGHTTSPHGMYVISHVGRLRDAEKLLENHTTCEWQN